jgi:hypothetical protein
MYLTYITPEQGGPTERLTTARNAEPSAQFHSFQQQPLQPAPDSRTVVDDDPWEAPPTASETLRGATSQDVYSGLGKPMQGMTSAELHSNGHHGVGHRKRSMQGTDQYGTADDVRDRDVDLEQWKPDDPYYQS